MSKRYKEEIHIRGYPKRVTNEEMMKFTSSYKISHSYLVFLYLIDGADIRKLYHARCWLGVGIYTKMLPFLRSLGRAYANEMYSELMTNNSNPRHSSQRNYHKGPKGHAAHFVYIMNYPTATGTNKLIFTQDPEQIFKLLHENIN